MMWPYWAVTYRYGFVRRSLLGTRFQAAAEGMGDDRQRDVVLALHVAATIALGACLVRWTLLLARGAAPRTRGLVFAGASAVALSQLFPTIAATAGYSDVYVLLLALGGAYLAWRGRALAAGLVTAAGR